MEKSIQELRIEMAECEERIMVIKQELKTRFWKDPDLYASFISINWAEVREVGKNRR